MAIEITRKKKNYQEHAGRYAHALTRLAPYRRMFFELVDEDPAAYRKVMDAYKMPKDSAEREKTIQEALLHATDVPARTAQSAFEALTVLEELRAIIHPNVASDLEVGLHMLPAALQGGIANMRINLKDISDPKVRAEYEAKIKGWTS